MNNNYLNPLRKTLKVLVAIVMVFNASWITAQTIDIGPPDTAVCTGASLELTAVFAGTNIDYIGVVPTTVNLTPSEDDRYSTPIDIGFNFSFFGNVYTQCLIASNNYITFDLSDADGFSPWAINSTIPNPGNPTNSIMCPWQDIHPGLGGTISYATFGTAPNRVFVVSYFEVPMFSCTGDCFTNQIVLYEGTNVIETHIFEKPLCPGWNNGNAIHGVQNAAGTVAFVVPGRNYPNQWPAQLDGYQFSPDGVGGFTLAPIPFSPFPMGITNGLVWTDDQGAVIGTNASITVNPSTPTMYTATWSSSCVSETYSDSILVTVGNVDITVSPSDASCFEFSDGSVEIDPVGSTFPVTLTLEDTNAVILQQVSGVNGLDTLEGLPAGDYTATVTDGVGCATSLDFTINQPLLLVPNTGHFDILCNGDDNGRAFTTPTGGTAPYSWVWNDPLSQSTDTIEFLAAGSYTLTVTDAQNCVSDTTIIVSEPLPLILDINSGADTCLYHNGTIFSEMRGGVPPYNYIWNVIRDSAHFETDDVNDWNLISGLTYGDYSVLIVDSNGCEIEGTATVDLISPPVADFTSRSKPEEFIDPNVQFDNESSAALTYEWHFGDGTVSYDEYPEHAYDTSGVFLVMLIAYNDPVLGCADTTYRYMEVDPMFTFYIPNAFTPDDDGLNDGWGPVGQNFEYESYHVEIYDKWGTMIWQSDNPDNLWDGNHWKSSKEVKQGLYVYVFSLKKFNTFEPKVISGTVTLYRN